MLSQHSEMSLLGGLTFRWLMIGVLMLRPVNIQTCRSSFILKVRGAIIRGVDVQCVDIEGVDVWGVDVPGVDAQTCQHSDILKLICVDIQMC